MNMTQQIPRIHIQNPRIHMFTRIHIQKTTTNSKNTYVDKNTYTKDDIQKKNLTEQIPKSDP